MIWGWGIELIFGPLTFSENWNQSLSETLTQFSPPTLQMFEFSPFNKILLSLFDVSYFKTVSLLTLK